MTHANDSGDYAITFTGDLSKCAVSATLVGGAIGAIVAVPTPVGSNTRIDVKTSDLAASLEERAFHVSVHC